jgi:HD-GYP domain-containing protein (c-di-GMP phosphodiesterase class II)
MKADLISVSDALLILAFMGDLSMGQPVDHSKRVAWLARRMANELGLEQRLCAETGQIALLRWTGCTANATEVANLMSDDVQGRRAMLAARPGDIKLLIAPSLLARRADELRAIHCEVSVIIAGTLGLSPAVVAAADCLFETWDGKGRPLGLSGDEIPLPVFLVLLAGDLEIFHREYGLPAALALLRQRADASYPQHLADLAGKMAATWLQDLEQHTEYGDQADGESPMVDFSLVADAIDLKLPWLTGHSRAVARLSGAIAARLDMPPAMQARIRRAALLHGLGRVAIPNAIWNRPGPFTIADWERVRLNPYWTARAATQIKSLEQEAEIASSTYERLDGSGYFRAARHAATSMEQRILPVASSLLALQAERPWRPALSSNAAIDHLQHQAALSRFDQRVINALDGVQADAGTSTPATQPTAAVLSPRELEVLRCIAHGDSNKAAARKLGLSPSTIRTHVENTFRKLECNSRAAATLKASLLGLL